MRFNFHSSNDFAEPVDFCIRCGHETRERCELKFPGFRGTLWACPSCRYEISAILSIFGEWFLRSVIAARDAAEAGEPVAEYANAFNFGWAENGTPLTKNRTQKKR